MNTVYSIQQSPGSHSIIARTPLRDEVYRQLLDRIARGDLPPGSRVRDTQMASQMGVSRTPVREALLRLAREGVVDADMGRGFSVRALDATEMRETGAILSDLEGLAMKLSGEISVDRLAELGAIDRERTSSATKRFLSLPDVPLPEWSDLKREIEDRRGARLP